VQLLALPIYLRYWDVARYGTWLMLSAVPAYFTMADVGMLTAAGNKMTMDIGRGDLHHANRTFQSAFVFMLITCLFFLMLTIGLLSFVNFPLLDHGEYKVTLGLLISVVLLAFFNGLAEAVFRSTGRYGLGTTLGNTIRLAELSGGMIGLWSHGSFVAVALGMLLARATGVFLCISYAIYSTRQIHWGMKLASVAEVRAMIKPAAMFMVFPVVNALSFQGFTLLVGGIFGTVSAAIFNTYRTMARVSFQATSTLSTAVGPEMSRLYGASNMASLRTLFVRSNRISALIAFGVPVTIALFAPKLLAAWTHGRIPYQPSLLFAMLLYAAVSSLWHVPRVLLISINRHIRMAAFLIVLTLGTLLVGWVVGENFSVAAVVWVLIVSELIMAIITNTWARRIVSETHENVQMIQKRSVVT
jgi:O-antigen/teichoic acid export membrane protein